MNVNSYFTNKRAVNPQRCAFQFSSIKCGHKCSLPPFQRSSDSDGPIALQSPVKLLLQRSNLSKPHEPTRSTLEMRTHSSKRIELLWALILIRTMVKPLLMGGRVQMLDERCGSSEQPLAQGTLKVVSASSPFNPSLGRFRLSGCRDMFVGD